MTENREREYEEDLATQVEHLRDRLETLEKFVVDQRFSQREDRVSQLERRVQAQRKQGSQHEKLMLALAGAVFIALAGVEYQNGKFSWLFSSQKAQEIVNLVGVISTGVAALGAGAIVIKKSGESEGEREPEPETQKSSEEENF